MRLLSVSNASVGTVVSDGRFVVAGVVQGHTHVIRRRTGKLHRLHVEEWTADALIDDEVLYLVGGRTGTLRAVGLIDGGKRPCPSLTHADAVRLWAAPGAPSDRGLVVGCVDGLVRTFDAAHRPLATIGRSDVLEAFGVHGTTVVTAYEGSALRAHDCRTAAPRFLAPDTPTQQVLDVHVDPEGVVVSGYEGELCAYDPELRPVRSVRLPDALGRLCADPRDARVLHGKGAEAVLRLDRGTLEVLERVPIASLHDGFSVDALGRLVGVEGGIEMIDPLPPPPPPDPEIPDIEVLYDRDATFDKDLPGMRATAVEITQHDRRVTVCTWYHEEGSRKDEGTVQRGTLERVEAAIVHLTMDDGSTARFDLTTRRLV